MEQAALVTRTIQLLFGGGVVLAGMAGAAGGWGHYSGISLVLVGVAMMAAGCWLNGLLRPETGLLLLIGSNAAFWLSFLLWQVLRGNRVLSEGIDPYAGLVAFWLILLSSFVLYEAVVFLKGLMNEADRRLGGIGLVLLLVQIPVTIRHMYRMVEGV